MARVGVYSRHHESVCPTSIYCRRLEEKLLARAGDLSRVPGPLQFCLLTGCLAEFCALQRHAAASPSERIFVGDSPYFWFYIRFYVLTWIPQFHLDYLFSYFVTSLLPMPCSPLFFLQFPCGQFPYRPLFNSASCSRVVMYLGDKLPLHSRQSRVIISRSIKKITQNSLLLHLRACILSISGVSTIPQFSARAILHSLHFHRISVSWFWRTHYESYCTTSHPLILVDFLVSSHFPWYIPGPRQ